MSDESPTSYGGGRLRVDKRSQAAELDGDRLILTPTEWTLLSLLTRTPGRVIPRQELAGFVLGRELPDDERNIDAHMKNLRRKLADRSGEIVETIHGVGYRLRLSQDQR
jgi:DNA-binding response OmpR family regulator